jgi:hypothetical protein
MLAEAQRSPAADRASATIGSRRTSSAEDSHSVRFPQRLAVFDRRRDAVLAAWRERCARVPLLERGKRAWR